MKKDKLKPDVLFEVSWEVCNMVGGIYTVLSTRAKTLQKELQDRLIFIGPDLSQAEENPLFTEENQFHKDWIAALASSKGLDVRVGRWNIPGKPLTVLVDYSSLAASKNELYAWMWENFGVESDQAYGDYDESSLFAYGAGLVAESYYNYYELKGKQVVYQAHEWMTGMGALYLQKAVPDIATIFTTHATTVGRSIAGNYKPLYDYLPGYFGDQMSQELNVRAKHSVEKAAAQYADCFTTVSELTAVEAEQILERKPEVVLKNGFENDFVPKGAKFTSARKAARAKLLEVAQKVLGTTLADDTLIVGTSGRYELKNKGLDVFIDALTELARQNSLTRDVLAYIFVPAWVGDARQDLIYRLKQNKGRVENAPLEYPYLTHWLNQMEHDQILSMLRDRGMCNGKESRVKIIFVPCYLDGKDGIFNLSYYNLLIGQDLTVYPSYYEPWGYTPLESIAFKIPTITTSLSGFGRWVQTVPNYTRGLEDGVEVIERTDHNYEEVVKIISNLLNKYALADQKRISRTRNRACQLAQKALWSEFIPAYYAAYDIALRHKNKRVIKTN